jgi:hypothetical protein
MSTAVGCASETRPMAGLRGSRLLSPPTRRMTWSRPRGPRTAIRSSTLRELTGFCPAVDCMTPGCRGEPIYSITSLAACYSGKRTVRGHVATDAVRQVRQACRRRVVGDGANAQGACPATSSGAAGLRERHACKESPDGRAHGVSDARVSRNRPYAGQRDLPLMRRGLRLRNSGLLSSHCTRQIPQLYSWKCEEDRLNLDTSEFTFI